ncbi:MAG: hypothetical protein U1D55_11625 [Phycisphaerae bacterium]
MLSKLYNFLAIIAIATVLSSAGFLGYLAGTGKLTGERIEAIAAVLRGDAPKLAANGERETATTQPAEGGSAEALENTSVDDIAEARAREQLRRASLERAERDVRARQELLDQALQQLITQQEAFDAAQKQWTEKRAKLTDTMRDEGFQRELQYVEKLAPKQAKEHVIRSWKKQPADVVRLFNALDPSKGQKILDQFKTTEELDIVHALLEQVRTQQSDSSRAEEGKSPDDASE